MRLLLVFSYEYRKVSENTGDYRCMIERWSKPNCLKLTIPLVLVRWAEHDRSKDVKPKPVIAKMSLETLAEMIGTTRSRVSFFMNRFRNAIGGPLPGARGSADTGSGY